MRSYSSKDIMKILECNGWILKECVGSHHQYIHPTKPGKVTLKHPQKDVPIPTIKSIEKQSEIKFN